MSLGVFLTGKSSVSWSAKVGVLQKHSEALDFDMISSNTTQRSDDQDESWRFLVMKEQKKNAEAGSGEPSRINYKILHM